MKKSVLAITLILGAFIAKAQPACITVDQPSIHVVNQGNQKQMVFDYSNAAWKDVTVVIKVNGVQVVSDKLPFRFDNNKYTYTSSLFTAQKLSDIDIEITSRSIFDIFNLNPCIIRIHPFSESPLPVTFGAFSATRSASSVLLKWETFTESNNTGFNVERFNNGSSTWESIAFIATQANNGNSNSKLSYQYTDNNNSNTISQYRIKQTDFDGKFSYSKVCAVQGHSQVARTVIFPNPSSNGNVTVSYPDASVRNIALFDMTGRSVKEWKNYSNTSLQIDNLTPGMYTLRTIGSGNEANTEKIIVTKN
ncbi:MAG: hypothetical protein B6D37_05835 [Sphingobacteriales bacterium UTBCD1]|jgi:hypothetical protein|nr:MAG: hypothetical protein B6D37_05835 [Sphingobacteriales bacterium UTBCD1]